MTGLADFGPCDACADGAVFETFASGCPACGREAPDDGDGEGDTPRWASRFQEREDS